MIQEALVEVEELHAAFEWDVEDQARIPPFVGRLRHELRSLLESMRDGSYTWANGELPFIELTRRNGPQIPFADLLDAINETHCKGLDVDTA
jgi:hypothetical protein